MGNRKLAKNILFIEDETMIQDLFGNTLLRSNSDWIINNATSLLMALEMLDQEKYDAIILDIGLPDAVPEVVISKVVNVAFDTKIIVLSGCIYEDNTLYKQ